MASPLRRIEIVDVEIVQVVVVVAVVVAAVAGGSEGRRGFVMAPLPVQVLGAVEGGATVVIAAAAVAPRRRRRGARGSALRPRRHRTAASSVLRGERAAFPPSLPSSPPVHLRSGDGVVAPRLVMVEEGGGSYRRR